jgi:hypothetical protein
MIIPKKKKKKTKGWRCRKYIPMEKTVSLGLMTI